MNHSVIASAVAPYGLQVLGGFVENGATTLLLGPTDNFWAIFSTSPEYQDGGPDPIDRWSIRIITALSQKLAATPHLPFGGPPYAPFLNWALKSGRCWSSPVGMLVHDTMGLMVSFRGGLTFDHQFDLPKPPSQSPCETCPTQPCKSACPVNALGADGYKTDACHTYLNTAAGRSCLTKGCAARRICPISRKRPDAQSAHHMNHFHK